jgi:hypothetical protein
MQNGGSVEIEKKLDAGRGNFCNIFASPVRIIVVYKF